MLTGRKGGCRCLSVIQFQWRSAGRCSRRNFGRTATSTSSQRSFWRRNSVAPALVRCPHRCTPLVSRQFSSHASLDALLVSLHSTAATTASGTTTDPVSSQRGHVTSHLNGLAAGRIFFASDCNVATSSIRQSSPLITPEAYSSDGDTTAVKMKSQRSPYCTDRVTLLWHSHLTYLSMEDDVYVCMRQGKP